MITTLEINLGGSRYPVACSEAEAPRVKLMAQQLQDRLSQLHKELGQAQVPDAHLLALLGLILIDEVAEAQNKPPAELGVTPEPIKSSEQDNEALFINAVSHLTDRVNLIARRLKAA